jgi:hypothetical protein
MIPMIGRLYNCGLLPNKKSLKARNLLENTTGSFWLRIKIERREYFSIHCLKKEMDTPYE